MIIISPIEYWADKKPVTNFLEPAVEHKVYFYYCQGCAKKFKPDYLWIYWKGFRFHSHECVNMMKQRNPEPETGWAGRFHIDEIKESLEWAMHSLGLPEDPKVTIENTINTGERLKVCVWVDVKISDI